jgi:hypothetical protein
MKKPSQGLRNGPPFFKTYSTRLAMKGQAMTQSDLMQEIEEEVQRKRMEALWQKYGLHIIILAAVIVIGTAGFVSWKNYRAKTEIKATTEYMSALLADKADLSAKTAKLEAVAKNFSGESQATLALLHEAGLLQKSGETDKAVVIYDKIASDTKVDTVFRQLADLSVVQSQMDKGDAKLLLKRLEPLMAEGSVWRSSAREYAAHLCLKSGDKVKAVEYFSALSQDKEVPAAMAERATDMLRYLAVEGK